MKKPEVRLRKFNSNLVTGGWAIIVFSAWDVVKFISSFFINSTYSQYILDNLSIDNSLMFFLEILFISLLLGILLFLHVFVGRCAINTGRGKKQGVAYIVIGIILAMSTVVSLMFNILDMKNMPWEITLSGTILDATMLAALIDLLISSFMVRHLRKKIVSEGGA